MPYDPDDDFDGYDGDVYSEAEEEAMSAYMEWEDSAAGAAYYDTYGEGYGWGSDHRRGWSEDDSHDPDDSDVPDFGGPALSFGRTEMDTGDF